MFFVLSQRIFTSRTIEQYKIVKFMGKGGTYTYTSTQHSRFDRLLSLMKKCLGRLDLKDYPVTKSVSDVVCL